MAVLPILEYPDKRLREPARPVEAVTPEIQRLVDDMAETMYAAPGVGLAANQVGVLLRIFVIDTAGEDDPSDLKVFINPEITSREGEMVWQEGCLSFPGVTESVERAERVHVRALDRDGKPFELDAEGLLSVAVQHENEHLDGKLMIDKLGPVKKRLVQRKMQKRAEGRTSSVDG
ncbi:MAG: peptide deformylase [Deltaproteobacteria bacterium]|nr:peptide deformylase [Deltaproteobacteria bacterium]